MYKRREGITLAILTITVAIIIILTGTIVVNTNRYLDTKKLINMQNDIKILQETMPIYYEQNHTLPTNRLLEYEEYFRFGDQKNANDNSEYYIIDLELLKDLQLNYGYGKESNEDYYVVNTGSFAVYYLEGIYIDEITHYTLEQTNTNINNNIQTPEAFNISTEVTNTTIKATGSTTSEVGIKGYKFRINNEQWTDIQTTGEYVFENLTSGETYKISMQAIDNNNNIIMADNNGIEATTISSQMTNGMFDIEKGINTPDTSKLPSSTTKYVTWDEINGTFEPKESENPINEWYDYNNGKWANIKTTSTDEKLEAYWVWMPRFAYRLPKTTGNGDEKEIEVIFVRDKSKVGANGEKCYYATDPEITTGSTGLYTNATPLAKGTQEGNEQAWIIHPAFWWDNNSNGIMEEDEQLAGIWFAKYEASSSNPSAENGGGNVTTLKVQVKPGVPSWRTIQTANAFTVCESINKTGGALGTTTGNTTIDSHLTKNLEWGAIAILSQSKYGIFNPMSSTGTNGDKTYKVWNNPNKAFRTGTVGTTADDANIEDQNCIKYNTGNGPKASTTGTVYGIYDMAGGAGEGTMDFMAVNGYPTVPAVGDSTTQNTGFTGRFYDGTLYTGIRAMPASKYYGIYPYSTNRTDYARGKIGDATAELKPTAEVTWNSDYAFFLCSSYTQFYRGGNSGDPKDAGVFAFSMYGKRTCSTHLWFPPSTNLPINLPNGTGHFGKHFTQSYK